MFNRNQLDGRPVCAPSHWNENFRIFYLTEKMRCQNDFEFASLCDRVARGTVTEKDEIYLRSRIKTTPSENDNDMFKFGRLSIIVTTNPKRNLINTEKLAKLLPHEREYVCDSTDRITNLPSGHSVPDRLKHNLGKTGNLETELVLKIGAPVVITSNHDKQKYRDDGIMNGARGYVQAITVSKVDQEKVEIIWVVFKNEKIGKRYRFEHSFLLKDFNPGHDRATPIFPVRRNFTEEFGSVEYQRTNFPLSLAYALTAHKCQGDTLEEVIIDFGEDISLKIKSYICSGSFYVALTRVREGCKVFLRNFDPKYIKFDKTIEEKVNAMRKFRPYQLKKVYLHEQVFNTDEREIKVGYLNINGLMDGKHAIYINADHNLLNLDVLVLAETKLDSGISDEDVMKHLDRWKVLGRYDSKDGLKHMGLMLLSSLNSLISNQVRSLNHQVVNRSGNLQIQGLILELIDGLSFGFIYCRSTPNNSEIRAIRKFFDQCAGIMGDFNLSHRTQEDQGKMEVLCQDDKFSALTEITRSRSNNQLDYIILKKMFQQCCLVSSYHNFISDHNSITLRFNIDEGPLLNSIKERIYFDPDSHLRAKNNQNPLKGVEISSDGDDYRIRAKNNQDPLTSDKESSENEQDVDNTSSAEEQNSSTTAAEDPVFMRRFKNPDMATCWLNSCLQLLLSALDQHTSSIQFDSELGIELKRLQINESGGALDPTGIKDIIVACEDTRIAIRLSELQLDILHPDELEMQSRLVQSFRLDLSRGQQCVRDFFVALNQNMINWLDVYNLFVYEMISSTTCTKCKNCSQSESLHFYEEMDVPMDQTNAKIYIEQFFNGSTTVDSKCERCKEQGQGERRATLKSCRKSKFIILIFSRAIESERGYQLNQNTVTSTDPIIIK